MFNPERILGQLLTSGMGAGRRSGLGGLGKLGGASIGMGLLGVAVAAFEHYSEKSPATTTAVPPPPPAPGQAGSTPSAPPPPPGIFSSRVQAPPPPPAANNSIKPALVVLRVMIAAANADGAIDDSERQSILKNAGNNLSTEDLQGLECELDHPQSLDTLLPLIDTTQAADYYAAALSAITVDSLEEKAFLDQLATGINLDEYTRQSIDQQWGIKQ